MGVSHSVPCNNIARDIWLWCKDRDIWITPAHIPGVENTEADLASRVFNDQTEWKLDPLILTDIFTLFGKPDLDLFASRLNHQLSRYVSWTLILMILGQMLSLLTGAHNITMLSSIQSHPTGPAKIGGGPNRHCPGGSLLANSVLVSQIDKTPHTESRATSRSTQPCALAFQSRKGRQILSSNLLQAENSLSSFSQFLRKITGFVSTQFSPSILSVLHLIEVGKLDCLLVLLSRFKQCLRTPYHVGFRLS